tara:strand:- start:931 stop:1332 length:402 start_codon:yes stop_codon:yes gene_type:complete
MLINNLHLLQILCLIFLSILFLQSSIDKIYDWKGNIDFFKSHFSKTIFKNFVFILLVVITLFEFAAGLFSLIGTLEIFYFKSYSASAVVGSYLSGLSIVMLFFGQRIAKDYAGAASLVPYFIVTLITIYIVSF